MNRSSESVCFAGTIAYKMAGGAKGEGAGAPEAAFPAGLTIGGGSSCATSAHHQHHSEGTGHRWV